MKRLLTGIKPTSNQIHIGNYFWALKPFLEQQNSWNYECYFFIATLHAFTQFHQPQELKNNILNQLKIYLACGLDPNKTLIYNQTDIPWHTQLQWVLSCLTNMGTMERMHAYKDAVAKEKAWNISLGTFNYPILQAADILLYDAECVPIGKDQKQHVEFARDIAQKFNKLFGDTFKIPEPLIQEHVAIIPGIDGRKMSKSYNNYIGLLDDEKTLLKKIQKIATETKTVEESKDPDTCNVFQITKLFLSLSEEQELRKTYLAGGMSYKYAKDYCFEVVKRFLSPIQESYSMISDQEAINLLKNHWVKANHLAQEKIQHIYKNIGFSL